MLKQHNVVEGEIEPITSCLEGNEIVSVKATHGGFVLPHVGLMDFVEQGQLVAIQYDSFGTEVERYTAPPTSGTVLSHNVESIRAPGSLIVRLIK